jgi:HlyD family secretion protein
VRFSPATVEGVVTYKAILTVDNADLSLRPGMTATADIVVDEVADTLLIPNAALRYTPPAAADTGGTGGGFLGLLIPRPPTAQREPVADAEGRRTIWVLRDGAPVAVLVRTGLSDGNHTAITEGDLSVSDAVIVGARTAS